MHASIVFPNIFTCEPLSPAASAAPETDVTQISHRLIRPKPPAALFTIKVDFYFGERSLRIIGPALETRARRVHRSRGGKTVTSHVSRFRIALMGGGAVLLWAAAQPAAAAAASGAGATNVDTVVVTARRSSEKLQEVPIAVTAVTAKQLETLKPRTLEDHPNLEPKQKVSAIANIVLWDFGKGDQSYQQLNAVGYAALRAILEIAPNNAVASLAEDSARRQRTPEDTFKVLRSALEKMI